MGYDVGRTRAVCPNTSTSASTRSITVAEMFAPAKNGQLHEFTTITIKTGVGFAFASHGVVLPLALLTQ
jgi:hypothetical protein